MGTIKLFLDMDGVLLGRHGHQIILARGADKFLEFVTQSFDCYWLTTHCQGKNDRALARMKTFVSTSTYKNLAGIKPTRFNVLKTEVLPKGELFYWVEDQPLASERLFLEENDLLSCWLKVNTYKNEEDLLNCLSFLRQQHTKARDPA